MDLTLSLDPGSTKPLQAQVFDQVREIILDGRLNAGMALPPSRLLAERLKISRNTVLGAYERLAAEGYVERRGITAVLRSLEADGFVRKRRGSIEILDRNGLLDIACR